MGYWGFRPYVRVADRQKNATREMAKLEKAGHRVQPIHVEGLKIAKTFWGKAWCDNLEAYSDFANRLPRGRTYVRNGSVCDLQIEAGKVAAFVCGSELYSINIKIKKLTEAAWTEIKRECAGQVGSLVELLQGRLSKGVMDIVTRPGSGLFPKPAEIELDCSCPDWADMCKHVAAALYGIGARLDHEPELLFKLRGVDHLELITAAGDPVVLTNADSQSSTIAESDLSDVFGIELDAGDSAPVEHSPVPTAKPGTKRSTKTPRELRMRAEKSVVKTPSKKAPESPDAERPGARKKRAPNPKSSASKRGPVKRTSRK